MEMAEGSVGTKPVVQCSVERDRERERLIDKERHAAYKIATRLVAYRPQSAKALLDKLLAKGIGLDVAQQTVAKLQHLVMCCLNKIAIHEVGLPQVTLCTGCGTGPTR